MYNMEKVTIPQKLQDKITEYLDMTNASAKTLCDGLTDICTRTKGLRFSGYIHINAYTKVDLDYAASLSYLSRDRFNHVFKEVTGFAPNEYVRKIRVERAKPLLREEGMTVRECAESVGFDDVNYFCRVFKKETGVTPKKYAAGDA